MRLCASLCGNVSICLRKDGHGNTQALEATRGAERGGGKRTEVGGGGGVGGGVAQAIN